jgi:formylglycine-generating enzyme required for sulfatase activity
MANKGMPRIFLCHAKEDKARVKELYRQLKAAGYQPWLDEEDLLPGQTWWAEIKKIISDTNNLVVVCLSQNSISKRGVVQKEIKRALDVWEQMPEGAIYLIPARLEPCDVPDSLSDLHWVDLFSARGFEKLKRALDVELGSRPAPLEPELILIPAGEFLMGSDPEKDIFADENEQPQHRLYLPDYYMAKTPVTNAQYAAFVEAIGHRRPQHWEGGKPPKGKEDHPVVYVTWHDAMAYCNWLAEVTGKAYRLPSEAEWEKAARGTDGRKYPWGDELPDKSRCNYGNNVGHTTPVSQYSPRGGSPYRVEDVAGNVWEWTRSLWGKSPYKPDFKYPYKPDDGRENQKADHNNLRVLRGGSWRDLKGYACCVSRFGTFPDGSGDNVGFRVVVAQAPRDWFSRVIQRADPWISVEDIEKGGRWSQELANQLEQARIGLRV